jgi:peptide/nickel transport system substrate-binding protein
MAHRTRTALLLAFLLVACGEKKSGPIAVSAIGGRPQLVNPSRAPLDAASAYLVESVAQGLVRSDAGGEIEPALAQSWVLSDDGLRYTFRVARGSRWENGDPVTASDVVARLRAAAAPSSRNPLKPLLGAIDEIVKMTDDVLEIDLKAPRPNFLQLLAQPELGLVRGRIGSGPLRPTPQRDGSILLSAPPPDDEEDAPPQQPSVVLRGESAAAAVARFDLGEAELVLGGRLGDLPLARAAEPAATALQFDPVDGLLGLAFASAEGPLASPQARQALAMAIDRGGLVQALGVRRLAPRETLLPSGIEGLAPAAPAWSGVGLAERRQQAQRLLAGQHLSIRVALPEGPGYRLLFAWLRRDWATIGVAAERVESGAPSDLALVDEVAPAALASWYLRHFTCESARLCVAAADAAMDQARLAPNAAARRPLLAQADRALADAALFIPLATPIRWSLVAQRLSGFKPNAFGRHPAGELIAAGP